MFGRVVLLNFPLSYLCLYLVKYFLSRHSRDKSNIFITKLIYISKDSKTAMYPSFVNCYSVTFCGVKLIVLLELAKFTKLRLQLCIYVLFPYLVVCLFVCLLSYIYFKLVLTPTLKL